MVFHSYKAQEVFVSYSHKDQGLREELDAHLSPLKHQGLISAWHDRKILAGGEWAREIDTNLNTAQIILLLVSSDFINSPYCYGKEVERAMERHEAGEARVIPLILRPCEWQKLPFGKLQALPTDGRPVESKHWFTKDEAFQNIAKGIRQVIEALNAANPITKATSELTGVTATSTNWTLPKLKANRSVSFNKYQVRDEWIEKIASAIQQAVEEEGSLECYTDNRQGDRQIRILLHGKTIYALDIRKGSRMEMSSDDGISFAQAEGSRGPDNSTYHAMGTFKWSKEKEGVVLDLQDLSLLSSLGGSKKEYTLEEFLPALMKRIQAVVERLS